MVATIRFEVPLGALSIKHECETETSGLTIGFEFESFADGKLYLLNMNQPELEKHHKVFAFDATIAIDMTSEQPATADVLAFGPRPDQTIARLTYNIDIKGRKSHVVFDLPEKEYPEGCSSKIIDLERQVRMHQRVHEELRDEIKELRAERERRVEEDDDRQIIQVPFTTLVVSKPTAHAWMKTPGGYLFDEYKQHMESKENTTVDQIVDAFFDDGDKRLMFNMHYLNRVEAINFIGVVKTTFVCIGVPHQFYILSGWTASGFTFEVTKSLEPKNRSYSFGQHSTMMQPNNNGKKGVSRKCILKQGSNQSILGLCCSRLFTFESNSMNNLVKNVNDTRFYFTANVYACMIIQA